MCQLVAFLLVVEANVLEGGRQECILGHLAALDVLVQVLGRPLMTMNNKRRPMFTAFLPSVVQCGAYLIVFVRVVLAEAPLCKPGLIHSLARSLSMQGIL